MRTNKACPMYSSIPGPMPQPVSISTSEEHEEPVKHSVIEEPDELVNVDGTKIKLSSKVMKVRFYYLFFLILLCCGTNDTKYRIYLTKSCF